MFKLSPKWAQSYVMYFCSGTGCSRCHPFNPVAASPHVAKTGTSSCACAGKQQQSFVLYKCTPPLPICGVVFSGVCRTVRHLWHLCFPCSPVRVNLPSAICRYIYTALCAFFWFCTALFSVLHHILPTLPERSRVIWLFGMPC